MNYSGSDILKYIFLAMQISLAAGVQAIPYRRAAQGLDLEPGV